MIGDKPNKQVTTISRKVVKKTRTIVRTVNMHSLCSLLWPCNTSFTWDMHCYLHLCTIAAMHSTISACKQLTAPVFLLIVEVWLLLQTLVIFSKIPLLHVSAAA